MDVTFFTSGRTTKMTDPNGNVTYMVYNDTAHETRVYPGFVSGATTGPIRITRQYYEAANSGDFFYTETLTSSATPHLTSGVPDGTETISFSNIQRLERDFTNDAGQVLWSDSYFNTSGLTYSQASESPVALRQIWAPAAPTITARSMRTTTTAGLRRRYHQPARLTAPSMMPWAG